MHDFITLLQQYNLSLLDLTGTIIGLFYIYYQFRVSWKLWLASFVMSALYVAINISGGVYGLACITAYYCCAAVYGLWQWLGTRQPSATPPTSTNDTQPPISHLPVRLYPRLTAIIVILLLLIAGFLTLLHETTTRWADATTSACSIVAMWLLAKKYIEQWVVWFVVDIINSVLYLSLGTGYIFSAGLYGFYALTCFFGYWYWRKQMPQE